MEVEAPVRVAPHQAAHVLPGVSSAPILIAHCDEDGVIEVASVLPPGHAELARGTARELHERFLVHARHVLADGRITFIVPGVPEADHAFIARVALRCWIDWCNAHERGAVVWNTAFRVDQ